MRRRSCRPRAVNSPGSQGNHAYSRLAGSPTRSLRRDKASQKKRRKATAPAT